MGVRKSFYQAAVFILKIFLLFIGAYLVYTGIPIIPQNPMI